MVSTDTAALVAVALFSVLPSALAVESNCKLGATFNVTDQNGVVVTIQLCGDGELVPHTPLVRISSPSNLSARIESK